MAAKQSSGNWQIALIIAAGIFIVLGSMLFWSVYSIKHSYDHITLSEVSSKTHIVFPSDSKLLNSTGISLMHFCLWVKVEMKPQDVEAFLKYLNNTHPVNISRKKKLINYMAGSPSDIMKGSFDWWNTAGVRRFISAESAVTSDTEIAVLIDLDNPDKAIVYLSYFND
ncbi:MAG: hypothetical protein ACYC27_06165 [Armatimonadota bacterium]